MRAVDALIERGEMYDLGRREYTVHDVEADWALKTFEPERDAYVVECDEEIVAYAQVMERSPSWYDGWGEVDPKHRGLGLGSHLVSWQEHRALQPEGPMWLHLIANAEYNDARALYVGRGYSPVRRFWTMERALDGEQLPAPLPGIEVRAPDEDEFATVHRVLTEAFRQHYGFRERTWEEFSGYFLEGPRSDPSQWLVALDGGRAVGALICTLYDEGWIDSLGVLAEARGRGIAKHLLRRAFAQIEATGLRVAALAVDTENVTGAVGLYESVGMRARIAYEHYRKVLRG